MYVCIFVYVHLFQLLLEKDTMNKNNRVRSQITMWIFMAECSVVVGDGLAPDCLLFCLVAQAFSPPAVLLAYLTEKKYISKTCKSQIHFIDM